MLILLVADIIAIVGTIYLAFSQLLDNLLMFGFVVASVVFSILLVIYSYFAFADLAKERDELRRQMDNLPKDDGSLRKDTIGIRDIDVKNIPNTLDSIYNRLKKLASEFPISTIDDKKVKEMTIQLFGAYDVNKDKLESTMKKPMNKLAKQETKWLGLKPKNQEAFAKLLVNLEGAMHNARIDILQMANKDPEYLNLCGQLKNQRVRISVVELNKHIDNYLFYARAFSNFMILLSSHADYTKELPHKYQVTLPLSQEAFDRILSQQLATINKHIENYCLGK